jgi:hypothetical protein
MIMTTQQNITEVHLLTYINHDNAPAVVVWENGQQTVREDFGTDDKSHDAAEDLAFMHAKRLNVSIIRLNA